MNLKKIGSRLYATNLFADFILSKIPHTEESIIKVVDCTNFLIIKGRTTYNDVLDLVTLTSEFEEKYSTTLGDVKVTHTIDLIEYGCKLPYQEKLTHTYHFSDNCSYSQKQIDLFKSEDCSYNFNFVPKKIEDTELVSVSEFPHGYSLNQGRLLYYYGKHLFYSVPSTYPYYPLTFNLTTLKDEDGENLFSVYNSYLNSEDDRLKSAILDVFDFDMSWLNVEMKKVDWSIELTNPLEEYSFIKEKNKDLILF
jgi:hypothetical protein